MLLCWKISELEMVDALELLDFAYADVEVRNLATECLENLRYHYCTCNMLCRVAQSHEHVLLTQGLP